MVKIISSSNESSRVERLSAEERLYFSTALGYLLRNFGDEVSGGSIRFNEINSGEWVCKVEVEASGTWVESEVCAPSKAIAFARAAEVLDRRIFSATFAPSSRAA